MRLIEYNDLTSPRQVIDVSGDGRETTFRYHSVPPSQARYAATAQGITVNGLAILGEEPDLAAYYRSEVIGGFGAFVMVAETIDDFGRAIREKLLREIEYRPVIGRLEFNPIDWNRSGYVSPRQPYWDKRAGRRPGGGSKRGDWPHKGMSRPPPASRRARAELAVDAW